VAGLCHNLGHPPFSYPFDDFVKDNLGISNWNHQELSTKLVDDIVDTCGIDIDSSQLSLVKNLIVGNKTKKEDCKFKFNISLAISDTQ
jgi:HD superfamily phosphohydrolase